MADRNQMFDFTNQLESLRARLANAQAAQCPGNQQIPLLIQNTLADFEKLVSSTIAQTSTEADGGLAGLVGIGDATTDDLGSVSYNVNVPAYDESVTSERLLALADLYYLYQHERVGVFRGVLKLQELFRSGQVRLSSGPGALALYRYDRRKVLRYTRNDRMRAYRRVFGYTNANPPTGSKPNEAFHALFTNFNTSVATFFRDHRISSLFTGANPAQSFGSIAEVRRAGLDLRSSLKQASYGHVNVMTVELSQLLDEAFEILGADDVMHLFGADNAWDALEELQRRYLKETSWTSQRSRMAITGRQILQWLSQPHIVTAGTAVEFETLLQDISDSTEEWLTSAKSLGTAKQAGAKAPVLKLIQKQAS